MIWTRNVDGGLVALVPTLDAQDGEVYWRISRTGEGFALARWTERSGEWAPVVEGMATEADAKRAAETRVRGGL